MLKYILFSLTTLVFTNLSYAQNNWVQLPDFPGSGRVSGNAMAYDSDGDNINDAAIFGLGRNSNSVAQRDIWRYSSVTGQWDSIGFPPYPIRAAEVLSLNNKFYFVAGAINNSLSTDEVWEYDPVANSWRQKTNYPGGAIYSKAAMKINNMLYFGLGNAGSASSPNHTDKFYQYDPGTDTWSTIADFPGSARRVPVSFSIDTDNDGSPDRAFVGLGADDNGFTNDIYEYLPQSNTWVQRADFPTNRASAIGQAFNDKAYIGFGSDGINNQTDFWEYDPIADTWTQLLDLPSNPVAAPNSFVIADTLYVVGGESNGITLREFWAYLPALSGDSINYINGSVYADIDSSCTNDTSDVSLAGWVVKAEPGPYYGVSNADGKYQIAVPQGNYQVSAIIPAASSFLAQPVCNASAGYNLMLTSADTLNGIDFAHAVKLCPLLEISVSSNRRRRCFKNTTWVSYCNNGLMEQDSVKVYVDLPSLVSLVSANTPFTYDSDSNLVFDIGTVAAGDCGSIQITDSVLCGNITFLGLTQCTEVWITPTSPCLIPDTTWNEADLSVTGACAESFESLFTVLNKGEDMTDSVELRVYADAVLALVQNIWLAKGDDLTLAIPNTGQTIRVEVDQVANHPSSTFASATVEACADSITAVSLGFVNQFPTNDESIDRDIECIRILGAYDPNDKQVSPIGCGPTGMVLPGTSFDYKIRFQNTGTDTAFTVVIIDTLSENLDISTLSIGAASHPFTYNISGNGKPILTFTFSNILLPDSTTDNLGSQGFIKFSIAPKGTLIVGDEIDNLADIYFDFNPPIRTNTVLNTIGNRKPVDRSVLDTILFNPSTSIVYLDDKGTSIILYPNPANNMVNIWVQDGEGLTYEVFMMDLQGKLVAKHQAVGEQVLSIDTKDVPQGAYLVRVVSYENEVKVLKLILAK